MPLSITAVDLRKGVVTLSDGSCWQVGPGDAGTIAHWVAGLPAVVIATGLTREVVCPDDGSGALVCPACPPGPLCGTPRRRKRPHTTPAAVPITPASTMSSPPATCSTGGGPGGAVAS